MFKNQDYTCPDRLLDKYAYMVNFRGFFTISEVEQRYTQKDMKRRTWKAATTQHS